MQRFDLTTILAHFDRAIGLTNRIRQELSANSDLEAIGQMYGERETILSGLHDIRHTLPGERECTEQWNKKSAQLVEADRELLSVLEVIRDTYQEKVRQSNQQKYLLIYSKGQRHGY